jgi:hypothetical protein
MSPTSSAIPSARTIGGTAVELQEITPKVAGGAWALATPVLNRVIKTSAATTESFLEAAIVYSLLTYPQEVGLSPTSIYHLSSIHTKQYPHETTIHLLSSSTWTAARGAIDLAA